jgi:fermentation-respiration switch protein FrsA (DUF1100 family)
LRLGLAGLLLILLLLMIFEESLIFIPSPYPSGEWNPTSLPVEDAWFQSGDGTKLHGWYLDHAHPLAIVLFCHGNAGNVTDRAEIMRRLNKVAQVSVLVFDYRGYGRSEGRPTEAGLLADARAARAWLAQRAGVREADILVMGESIGGAVAVDLAAADGARGLVLEHTFDRLANVAAYHFPWFPARFFLHTQFNSAAKIPNYHGPLLQTHGNADTVVPYRFGKSLFEAANEPKSFLTVPHGEHNDLCGRDYYERLRQFFAQLPTTAPSSSERP